MAEETLRLAQLAPERLPVEFPNGETFLMVTPEELSFYDRAVIGEIVERIGRVQEKMGSKPTEKKAADLEGLLRELTAKVLPDAPAGAVKALDPVHLDQVTGAFLGRYGDMIQRVAETMPMETGRTLAT